MKLHRWLWTSLAALAIPGQAESSARVPGAPVAPSVGSQVEEFFTHLLDPHGFPARWHCGHWTSFHGWLYILSDLLIWSAYFVIPFLLLRFIRQRRDMPFNRLFGLFGLFIFACGTTHLLDALIFWVPLYRLSGLVRLITALASWGTVWALVEVLPKALLLRTPSELEGVVQARTAELAAANQQLREVAEQLQRRNEEFSTLANTMPQLAWMADPDGRPFWYNQRWYDFIGASPEQLQSPEWDVAHHLGQLQPAATHWQEFVQSGEPWEDTFPLRRHDGEYRWFLSRALPVRNSEGQVTRWFGTNTDVTEMRQLQEKVQHSEIRYRVLLESIPQLIWTTDSAGEFSYCDQRMEDYTGVAAAWRGRPWHSLLHPDDQVPAMAQWQQALQTTGSLAGEYRLRGATGDYRWFLVQAHRLAQTEQWFGTCTDLHEQHTLRDALQAQNAELARTNRALDTFVYAASHDLKQPVQNLAGLFGELQRGVSFTDPEAGQMLDMVQASIGELQSTIQALTEVVYVQRPAESLPPEPVPLQPLVEEIIRSVQDLGPVRPTWVLNFSALPAVFFVRANLRSVLYNLLSNAVKYADPHRPARIAVRAELRADVPVLVVQDNGLGLDLTRHGGTLFHLFRRFHTHVPGSGVGLYLVHRLVEQAGGQLEVESEPGQGTTFRVVLPTS